MMRVERHLPHSGQYDRHFFSHPAPFDTALTLFALKPYWSRPFPIRVVNDVRLEHRQDPDAVFAVRQMLLLSRVQLGTSFGCAKE